MAIRWVFSAWNNDVKGSTIANCFKKSGVLYGGAKEEPREEPQEEEERRGENEGNDEEEDFEVVDDYIGELRAELEATMAQLLAQRRVINILGIDDFVMPSDEEVDDPVEDLTTHIVATIDTVDTESPEYIVNEAPQTRVTHDSAPSDADGLIAYAEQLSTSENEMYMLHSFRRIIQKRLGESCRQRAQQTLDT